MQHSQVQAQVQAADAPARLVAGTLWLGFAGAAVWALAGRANSAAPGLAMAMALLTLFVAALVASFSRRFMRADPAATRFFATLGALAATVLAALFANNLLVLGAAWCASGWLLGALIGHAPGWAEAAAAARRARRAFALGDAALLIALATLGWHAGSARIDAVLAGAPGLPPLLAGTAALLLVVAAAARCALLPFSDWLLSSMTAPTPVSALMHAGLVNAGGFLLLRFAPVMEAAPAARLVALALGLASALWGIGIMLVRPDVKRALAGSTVSQMGFMVMSCALGAYGAALWHIVAHGLFKAWLFLGAGSAIGLRPGRPAPALSARMVLAIAAGTAVLALTGLASGTFGAAMMPLLLGLATALATALGALGAGPTWGSRARLLLGLALLVACHAAGLALAARAVGADGPPLLPDTALLALLALFLGLWVWQQQRLASGRGLPLPLYVRLINAGALPATGPGEMQ